MIQHFTPMSVSALDKYYKRNLLNSISGYKAVTLIGTKSIEGISNIAEFSSVVHVGASPPIPGEIPITVYRQSNPI